KWSLFFEFFCLMFRLLRRSTIFPYTTLFRSYQYKLGSGTFGSEATFSGLSAGNYVVTVKDETGCFININASVASNTGITYNGDRSEEHTSELQSRENLVCRLLLEKKNKNF